MCYILSGICTCFFVVFVPDCITFATYPTVVESVTGSVPVEHPHKVKAIFVTVY